MYANVFSGSVRTAMTAVLRNSKGKETQLTTKHVPGEPDPDYVKLFEAEEKLRQLAGAEADWLKMSNPIPADHLWTATLPSSLKVGLYTVEFNATQPDGTQFTGLRTIRVVEKE